MDDMDSCESWTKVRVTSVFLTLVGMMLVGLVGISEDMAAASTTFSVDAQQKTLAVSGGTYPPTGTATEDDGVINVGQSWAFFTSTYTVERAYFGFDTSNLPDDAVILSSTLSLVGIGDLSISTDFDVNVFRYDYGASIESSDFDLVGVGAFQGTLLNTASFTPYTRYEMSVSCSDVNKTGVTSYVARSSRDNVSTPSGLESVIFFGFSASAAYHPLLEIVYFEGGTEVDVELDSGAWLNSTMFADIEGWNLTYDLWCFEIDTPPSTANVTIQKQNASWIWAGVAPDCNTTENDTALVLEDVYDSICYRIWFTVPKTSPYTSVHLSLFNAFTGEGFFWEQMKVQICDGATWDNSSAAVVSRPDFDVEPEQYYTIRVFDYFDNALVDSNFSANAQDVFVTIAVPLYSWQVFNMNDQPVLMKIYWNNSGAPWEFFVGPHWIVERDLKGGNYTFMVTFYDVNGLVGETVYFNRTVPSSGLNASFIYINGTTLTEVITDIEGMVATQEIITSLVTPSVTVVYEDLPLAPVRLKSLTIGDELMIDPYLVLEATTYQNASGTSLSLWEPHPGLTGATYVIVSDVLSFAGTYATMIYINTTAGSTLYTASTLPATYLLDGQNVTIWASSSITVSRVCTWREVSEYAVTYYPTQHKWTCTLNLNNTAAFDYYAPYWFIGFPSGAVVDQSTVSLYDVNNDIYLNQSAHFEVTSGGIHVSLTRLNASMVRTFTLTYWDYNDTIPYGAPNLIAYSYDTASYNGAVMKYTAVQWSNPYGAVYRGEARIRLNFTGGDTLKTSSIIIVETLSGRTLTDNQWIYIGDTIFIMTEGVGAVPVGGGVNFAVYFTFGGAVDDGKTDFFFGPIVYNGQMFYIGSFPVSIAFLVIIGMWAAVALAWWREYDDLVALVVIVGSITIILALGGVALG